MPSRMSSALSFTDDAEFAARPSSRFLAPPGGISNIFNDNADPIRPSSRVLQRPGGSTSDIFSTEPVVQRAIPADPRRYQSSFDEQPLNTIQSRGVNRRDPNQTSAQADEIKSMGRRTANASDESLPEEISHGRKHYGGGGVSRESVSYEPIHGKKHFDESSRESLSVLSATGSRSTTPNSEFALAPPQFGRGGRRDPNARSEEAVHRPSSR